MSFQHFRLGELAMHQPLPPHLMQPTPTGGPSDMATQYAAPGNNSFSTNPANSHIFSSPSAPKAPYGSGDTDDGYTLVFPNLAAFNEWREKEEITQMVEFVKGDTHGSKADPPRFKDHTKLVCARHSRSGRKKYIKKHPERQRKVPSRKLDGGGCSASISYKTYFDKEEVRASYNAEHSHPIGLENYPFTRRGRKAAVLQEKERSRKYQKKEDGTAIPAPPETPQPVPSTSFLPHQAPVQAPQPHIPGPSQPVNQFTPVQMMAPPHTQHAHTHTQFQSQPQPPYGYVPPSYGMQPVPTMENPIQAAPITQDRWQNMSTLFNSIREHSRTFNYPFTSVVALESVLIRLFLESPVSLQSALGPGGANPNVAPSISMPENHQHTNNPPPQELRNSDSDDSEDE